MFLPDYLKAFRQAVGKINDYEFAESIDIREEIRAAKQAVINAKIVLVDGSVLHIKEFIDAKYKEGTIVATSEPDISDVVDEVIGCL